MANTVLSATELCFTTLVKFTGGNARRDHTGQLYLSNGH